MMNDETKRKLREMNLAEMIEMIDIQEQTANMPTLSFNERFQRIVDYAYQEKFNSKVERLIKSAKLRISTADIRDIHYLNRGLDEQLIQELATCSYIKRYTNIICQGYTGSGKTFLACVLAREACKMQLTTRYIRLPDLLVLYDEGRLSGNAHRKVLDKFSKYQLLILDEWLIDELSEMERSFIFELIERRHDQGSTIFCSQFRTTDWHGKLGGGVAADAILDRIIHNAISIETGQINMREYRAKQH